MNRKKIYHIIKEISDYTISVACLVLLTPVILIISLLIMCGGDGPVIYSQKRTGRNGRHFLLYKFRSMHSNNEEGINLITEKDDKRLTLLGRLMRKYKIDEIPNFINVLKGEMSIIGPRPEQQYYIDKIIARDPRYSKLLLLKPGITSWGQVKYGYASDVESMIERMEYDLFYLEHRTPFFDLKIILYTMGIALKGRGV